VRDYIQLRLLNECCHAKEQSSSESNFPISISLKILSLASKTAVLLPDAHRTGDKKAVDGVISLFGVLSLPLTLVAEVYSHQNKNWNCVLIKIH
jgi:hypothetical protein